MTRIIPAIFFLLYAGAAPGAISQPLGTPEDFISRVHAGSVDLATFDFAAAGFWDLSVSDRHAWLSKVHGLYNGDGVWFWSCGREARRQWKNGMWMMVLSESRNAASWSESATALRAQLHTLDLAIWDAIGATAVTPASSRAERLRRRMAGDRVVRDERLDARLIAGLPRPAIRYWSGLKDTRLLEIDCANTDWLRAEVNRHGWFDIPTYGRQADSNAWQLLDHSVHDARYQRDMLVRLEALPPGATQPARVADLYDAVAVNSNQLQRYGTAGYCFQRGGWFLAPLEDPAGVDARRARVGLGPLADFVRTSKANCERALHPPVRARPSPRT